MDKTASDSLNINFIAYWLVMLTGNVAAQYGDDLFSDGQIGVVCLSNNSSFYLCGIYYR